MASTPVISEKKPQQAVKTANAALFYHPDGFDTSGKRLMGRQAAGESFLKGFAKHAEVKRYYCYTPQKPFAEDFHKRIHQHGTQKQTVWISPLHQEKLAEPGCLFVPGPGLSEYAWQRRHGNQRGYSLCGITHTTASDRVMDAIGDLLIAPVQPWDAVICTSHSVKSMVEKVLDNYHGYLSDRFGVPVPPSLVQLPVIPLGLDCDDFERTPAKEQAGQTIRQRLGIAGDDIAVLFMGRLSFHAKAHPLPMYLALEKAAQATGKKLHLILAGWFPNEPVAKEFKGAAATFCPSVTLHYLDGRKPEIRQNVWYAADISCSLSDNIQETFGITPIEAMAAGLPVVVSDWDGYKESVRDGVDGFLIPSTMPAAGSGDDLAFRYETGVDNYDIYIGQVSQTTAIDTEACAEAFTRLVSDEQLRQSMGQAGQEAARSRFDWSVIIPQYQALWAELAELRQQGSEVAGRTDGPSNPLRDDPFALFTHYPSHVISDDTIVTLTSADMHTQLQKILRFNMNTFSFNRAILPPENLLKLLNFIQMHQPVSVRQIALGNKNISTEKLIRSLGWLVKMDLLAISKA